MHIYFLSHFLLKIHIFYACVNDFLASIRDYVVYSKFKMHVYCANNCLALSEFVSLEKSVLQRLCSPQNTLCVQNSPGCPLCLTGCPLCLSFSSVLHSCQPCNSTCRVWRRKNIKQAEKSTNMQIMHKYVHIEKCS